MNRLILLLVIFLLSIQKLAFASFQMVPANLQNTQIVYGPKQFNAGLSSAKNYVESFAAKSSAEGVITVINGSGKDMHPVICSGSGFQKVSCLLGNISKKIEVALFRVKSIELKLNGIQILNSSMLTPEDAQILLAIKTANGLPVESVVNKLNLSLKGTPLSSIKISIVTQNGQMNQPPSANILANPLNGIAPQTVNFSGLQSTDNDGSIVSYEWNFGDLNSGASNTATGILAMHTFANTGSYLVKLKVTDNQGATAESTQLVSVVPNILPIASFVISPDEGSAPLDVMLDASVSSDADGSISSYNWDFGDGQTGSGVQISHRFNQAGTYVINLSVHDDKGGITNISKSYEVLPPNTTPSAVIGLSKNEGIAPLMVELNAVGSSDPDGTIANYSWDFGDGSTASGVRVTHEFKTGNFNVKLTVKDNRGAEAQASVEIKGNDPVLPINPATIAPVLSETNITLPSEMTEFLYTGANPIQTGVEPGTIDKRFVSVVRGKILQEDGTPLSGVVVSILGDAKYGQTISREDGQYDLVINGGYSQILHFERNGFYEVQREVISTHQAFAVVDDVYMLRPDPKVTVLATNSDIPQVAKGTESSDSDGARTAVIVMPSQTGASLRMADGSLKEVSQLSIRAKEYTVGENGPKRMPASLPSTSAYTYAVQLSADEVEAFGAEGIQFSKPVSFYVDNFLGFATGDAMPVGIYNLKKGRWEPSKNGRVIKIIAINNGKAVVDVTGNGAASSADLIKLGIDDEELKTLASSYVVGSSLWRVRLDHFSIVDINAFQQDVAKVKIPTAVPKSPVEQTKYPENKCGSIINVETRTLGESLGILGTPFSLVYSTSRVPGRASNRTLDIEITPGDLSSLPNLLGVDLKVSIAGQVFNKSFSAEPGQTSRFTWDGKDAYGRVLSSGQLAEINVSYKFQANYLNADRETSDESTFAFLGPGLIVTSINSREETIFTRTYKNFVGADESILKAGVAGWTLNVHHQYDPIGQVVYLGDGTKRSAKDVGNVITTVVGNGLLGYQGDGGPAKSARMSLPTDMFIAKDNSIYFRDGSNSRIRKVSPEGIISTFAGNGIHADGAEGVLATETSVDQVGGIALESDGELTFYLAETNFNRIKKISPNGIVTYIAGTGVAGFSGDGGPALLAQISGPTGLAINDGSIYFNDTGNNRIRVIRPDGSIQTIAGNGINNYSGDGGPAVDAGLKQPFGLSFGPNGDLYLAELSVGIIRRVDRSGIITTVAGGGLSTEDGIQATDALILKPTRALLTRDNTMIISNYVTPTLRKVGSDGIISTHAGTSLPGAGSGEFELAGRARLIEPSLIALGSDDSILIGDGFKIKKISRAFAGVGFSNILIPSSDASEIYEFSPTGKHLETKNALTGARKYKFNYDTQGRLVSVVDGDNNVTSLLRNSSGEVVQIEAPFGQVTTTESNDDGYLTKITNPNGESYKMTYGAGGLLSSFAKPRGNISIFHYDSLGQLVKDIDAVGGFTALSEELFSGGYAIPYSTAEGRISKVRTENDISGMQISTKTDPNGLNLILKNDSKGISSSVSPTRSTASMAKADPRLGAAALYPASDSVLLTSGHQMKRTMNRSVTYNSNNFFDFVQTDLISENGRSSSKVFNAQTRTWTMTSPEGRVSKVIIDSQGRPIKVQTANIIDQVYLYNSRGQLESITQGDHVKNYAYNSKGLLSSESNSLGQVTSFDYDNSDRMIQKTLPDGRIIKMNYDANSNMVGVTPAGKPEHEQIFNLVDMMTSYLPPILNTAAPLRYSYNLDKQLTSMQAADGKYASYIYSAGSDRLERVATDSGVYSYSYQPTTGLVSQIVSADGVTTNMSYTGGLVSEVSNSGQAFGTIGFTFDNDFRIISSSVNGGIPVNYTYGLDGYLKSAGSLVFNYSAQNSLLQNSQLASVQTSYGYNNLAELTSVGASFGSSQLYSSNFVRDALGRITAKSENIGNESHNSSFTYDLSGRLTNVVRDGIMISYVFDTNGNRLSKQEGSQITLASYNDQDQLLSYGNTSFSYTAAGSLATKSVGMMSTSFDYDIFGNLQKVILPNATQIEYIIDGQNRRVGKLINGVRSKFWVYESQLRIAAELDGAGQIRSRFIYGNSHSPEAMIKDGVLYKIISDQIGSPKLIVNSETGVVAQKIDYDEFGNILSDTNPGFQPFGFAGGLYDSDTKLVRFGARDYDPEVGRWTSKDPIGFAANDSNFYAYVFQDPINFIDPSGLAWEDVSWRNVIGGVALIGTGYGAVIGGAGLIGTGVGTPLGIIGTAIGTGGIITGISLLGIELDKYKNGLLGSSGQNGINVCAVK